MFHEKSGCHHRQKDYFIADSTPVGPIPVRPLTSGEVWNLQHSCLDGRCCIVSPQREHSGCRIGEFDQTNPHLLLVHIEISNDIVHKRADVDEIGRADAA
jgi:hypothetical protein